MSIFASVAIVCTLAACNEYHVDTAQTLEDGTYNTQVVDTEFFNLWGDEQQLNQWLAKNKVGETVFEIVSVEFETQEINENDIP